MKPQRIEQPEFAEIGAFRDGSAALLDIDKLVGSHLCIQANSGGGKSGAIRRLLETTHGRIQHIIIDVEDEFYTLREKFEYLIAGGDNGDCVANVNNAADLATMILKTGYSAIVQINGLPIDDRRLFIEIFLTTLLAAPKAMWRPLLVVLDEAQMYCPKVGKVESSEAVISLMTLGRKRGFTGVLATPRLAMLHNDATGPVNNWLMGRIGQPADRRTTADALGFSAKSEEAMGLLKMETRQFWAFGPALCLEPTRMRVGDAATTVIKAGQAAVPTPPAPAAMQRILAQLNAAATAAKKVDPETADVPTLRAEIARLTALTKATPNITQNITDPALIVAAEQRGYERGVREASIASNKELAQFQNAWDRFAPALEAIGVSYRVLVDANENRVATHLMNFKTSSSPAGTATPSPTRAPDYAESQKLDARAKPAPRAPMDSGPIGGVKQAILNSVAEMEMLCRKSPPRTLVAMVAGYKNVKSTGFAKALSGLSTDGLVTYPDSGTIGLTSEGLAVARPRAAALTTEDVHSKAIDILGETAGKILRHVLAVYPGVLEREVLAQRSGYQNVKSSGFAKALSRLSSLGFVSYPSSGTAKAGEILFPMINRQTL